MEEKGFEMLLRQFAQMTLDELNYVKGAVEGQIVHRSLNGKKCGSVEVNQS